MGASSGRVGSGGKFGFCGWAKAEEEAIRKEAGKDAVKKSKLRRVRTRVMQISLSKKQE
jgi:hypothetical protein